jgi:hypothetical protein
MVERVRYRLFRQTHRVCRGRRTRRCIGDGVLFWSAGGCPWVLDNCQRYWLDPFGRVVIALVSLKLQGEGPDESVGVPYVSEISVAHVGHRLANLSPRVLH